MRFEVEYRNAKRPWDHYISLKENRNTVRMALEEKYGYDTKSIRQYFVF